MFRDITFRKALYLYTIWWLVWTSIEWYLVSYYGVPWKTALLDAVVNVAQLVLTSIAVYNTVRFYRPTRGNLLYVRIWSILHAWFITAVHGWIMIQVNPDYLDLIEKGWPIRYFYNLIMIGISTAGIVIYYYIEDEHEKEVRKDDAEKLAKETELIKLRQQLQPHFLFNSLNSISALAGSKPEQARKMIQQLSDFLRGTLRKDDQQYASMQEELTHLQLYLEIEKVRFGHRLETKIECEPSCSERLLPSLLLQPIVENAIKFGLYDTTEQVLVEIQSICEGKNLKIMVRNPYDSATAQPRKGTGFGLSSVQRRLYLLYGRTDLLHTHAESTHFTTTITIPQP